MPKQEANTTAPEVPKQTKTERRPHIQTHRKHTQANTQPKPHQYTNHTFSVRHFGSSLIGPTPFWFRMYAVTGDGQKDRRTCSSLTDLGRQWAQRAKSEHERRSFQVLALLRWMGVSATLAALLLLHVTTYVQHVCNR